MCPEHHSTQTKIQSWSLDIFPRLISLASCSDYRIIVQIFKLLSCAANVTMMICDHCWFVISRDLILIIGLLSPSAPVSAPCDFRHLSPLSWLRALQLSVPGVDNLQNPKRAIFTQIYLKNWHIFWHFSKIWNTQRGEEKLREYLAWISEPERWRWSDLDSFGLGRQTQRVCSVLTAW